MINGKVVRARRDPGSGIHDYRYKNEITRFIQVKSNLHIKTKDKWHLLLWILSNTKTKKSKEKKMRQRAIKLY
jgi:hypothetical protein